MTTLWHNPRCSKSRAALDLLRARGVEPDVVDYLHAPPSVDEISAVASMLDAPVRSMVRTDEPEYAALALDRADDAALIAAMHAHPRLIQRPLLICGSRAVIGRPPERVLELLANA